MVSFRLACLGSSNREIDPAIGRIQGRQRSNEDKQSSNFKQREQTVAGSFTHGKKICARRRFVTSSTPRGGADNE